MTNEEIESVKAAVAATISVRCKDFIGVPLTQRNVMEIQAVITQMMKDYANQTKAFYPILDEIQWDVKVTEDRKIQVVPFPTTDRAWYFLRGIDMSGVEEP